MVYHINTFNNNNSLADSPSLTDSIEGFSRFSDMTVGVSDTSVFDIPDMCNSEPRKCCFPSNWTATIVELGGQINLAETKGTIFHVS